MNEKLAGDKKTVYTDDLRVEAKSVQDVATSRLALHNQAVTALLRGIAAAAEGSLKMIGTNVSSAREHASTADTLVHAYNQLIGRH